MKKATKMFMSILCAMALIWSMPGALAIEYSRATYTDVENGPGWREQEVTADTPCTAAYFEWEERDSSWHSTSIGGHNLTSYIMRNNDDTKFVKASTDHFSNSGEQDLNGYSRARFETVLGKVVAGTDSDRVWNIGHSDAVSEKESNAIGCTYCGDRTTI